ncbi:MAG TPA: hypothetical protein VNJ49_16830 [Bradyrhizobium sp.]|nr:hypothetical protein [Bradyrhizobium sp.]
MDKASLAVIKRQVMPALPAFDQQVLDRRIPEQEGFTVEDILWAIGIWSVLLTMSPVILFYMLMVA